MVSSSMSETENLEKNRSLQEQIVSSGLEICHLANKCGYIILGFGQTECVVLLLLSLHKNLIRYF